jgi:hypothetical protein
MNARPRTTLARTLVLVGAAAVLLGTVPHRRRGCPAGSILIDERYCIDRYEASLREVIRRGVSRPWTPYRTPESGHRYVAVSRRGVVPQGYMSQVQAADACREAGKRLCTETEWTQACHGPTPTIYPYGDQHIDGRCNDSGDSPVLRVFYPERDVFHEAQMNDPRLNTLPHTLARTGAFARCTNRYGVHDMVGNLHEWVDAHYGRLGVFRGGFYEDTHQNGDGCNYATRAHSPNYHDYSTGFRCCADLR